MTATITALGHYVPPEVRDNAHFAAYLDTSDAWIQERTGIRERRVLHDGATSDLAAEAGRRCLAARGLAPADVDGLIVATCTPDHLVPHTAAIVAGKLGITGAWGYDLVAACSGFVFALATAAALVSAGTVRRCLVIGAERMSAVLDPSDRNTVILFGDGAGAVLVERLDAALATGVAVAGAGRAGILDFAGSMDGAGAAHLMIPAGGSAKPATAETVAAREHFVRQDGRVVFKAAVAGMSHVVETVLARNGLTPEAVRWLVPHQANLRIIDAVGRRLGIPAERVVVNLDTKGNTTAATVPLALSEWHAAGRLQPGDDIVLCAFGAGFAAGANYLRWSLPAPLAPVAPVAAVAA